MTVATTSNAGPGHPFDEGIILYVTVPFVNPSVAVRTWDITFPDPAIAPETLVLVRTVHENVVPVTAFGLVIRMLVDCPEHMVWGFADAVGTGLTVTTKFTGVPLHPETLGVIS